MAGEPHQPVSPITLIVAEPVPTGGVGSVGPVGVGAGVVGASPVGVSLGAPGTTATADTSGVADGAVGELLHQAEASAHPTSKVSPMTRGGQGRMIWLGLWPEN